MTKDELAKHLRVIHGATITELKWTTKADLEGAHADFHVKERAAHDVFRQKGKKRTE